MSLPFGILSSSASLVFLKIQCRYVFMNIGTCFVFHFLKEELFIEEI